MKKHLLFAVMLAMGAAPAVATPVVNGVFYEESSETSTPATEEEYNALVKSIEDLQKTIKAEIDEIETAYPLAETLPAALKGTLSTGDDNYPGLAEILSQVKAKYNAQTLTSKEVAAYQETVNQFAQGMTGESYEQAKVDAAAEHASGLMYQYAGAAKDKISEAGNGLENYTNVKSYFVSALDDYVWQISSKQYQGCATVEQAEALKKEFDAIADQAVALAANAQKAEDMVKDMKETLPAKLASINKGKEDFPDYGWDEIMEYGYDYWNGIFKTLTHDYDGEGDIYTASDIDALVENYGYFKDEDPYASAQKEDWSTQYNAKYFPVSQRIEAINGILDAECSQEIAQKYMAKLEDLGIELTQNYFKLAMGNDPITEEDFNKLMARIDEIAAEAEKVLTDARAEQQATGINGITINDAVKSGKAWTLDGKRTGNSQKGIVIVNGKKIVLK